jgi:hypothetical protein
MRRSAPFRVARTRAGRCSRPFSIRIRIQLLEVADVEVPALLTSTSIPNRFDGGPHRSGSVGGALDGIRFLIR